MLSQLTSWTQLFWASSAVPRRDRCWGEGGQERGHFNNKAKQRNRKRAGWVAAAGQARSPRSVRARPSLHSLDRTLCSSRQRHSWQEGLWRLEPGCPQRSWAGPTELSLWPHPLDQSTTSLGGPQCTGHTWPCPRPWLEGRGGWGKRVPLGSFEEVMGLRGGGLEKLDLYLLYQLPPSGVLVLSLVTSLFICDTDNLPRPTSTVPPGNPMQGVPTIAGPLLCFRATDGSSCSELPDAM